MNVETVGLSVGLTLVVGIAFLVVLRVSLGKAEDKLGRSIAEMTRWIVTLANAAGESHAVHSDLARRIVALEAETASTKLTLRVLRMRTHAFANRLQVLDPSWKQQMEELFPPLE